MANTALGRTEIALLTNKSGGSVAQGDVVIVDTANASAFTTTTTGAYVNGRIGVVLEPNGIANNASGLIAFSGYVPTINLSGTGSIGDLVKTHTVAKQGVRHTAPLVAGDFAQVLGTSATPAALLFGAVEQGSSGGSSVTVGARVKRASGNVAITTSYASVGFDAEDYDTDAFHDTVTNNARITIPSGKDGKYHISASGYTSVAAIAKLLLNGTTNIAIGGSEATGAVISPFNVDTDYNLVAGDYIELQVRGQSGSGNVVYDTGVSPIFCIHRIGT